MCELCVKRVKNGGGISKRCLELAAVDEVRQRPKAPKVMTKEEFFDQFLPGMEPPK